MEKKMLSKAALRRKNETLAQRIEIARARLADAAKNNRTLKREAKHLQERVDELETNIVSEYCSECETEVEMVWDVEQDGYKAFCPFCGARLMLCDMCQHRGPDGAAVSDCDFNYGTDSCRFNPAKED